ncbi:MAG: hypothetical protein KC646_04630 [Candidatus Cloacimonetes bacterium]|nr:hypothetical protein [Candidatus Cloacimonadota bacterium]
MIIQDNIHILPIVHYNMEFATQVHEIIESGDYDAIAVELPTSIKESFCTAIDRLPYLSVILYPNKQTGTMYLQVESCDPIVEAVRSARERRLKIYFVDMDIDSYQDHHDLVPDCYALKTLSISSFYQIWYDNHGQGLHKSRTDDRRERYMAYRLNQVRKKHSKILMLSGMSHVEGIRNYLVHKAPCPMSFFRRQNATVYHLSEESSYQTMAESGYISTLYEMWREFKISKELPFYTKEQSKAKLGSFSLIESKTPHKPIVDQKQKTKEWMIDFFEEVLDTVDGHVRLDRALVLELLYSQTKELYERKYDTKIKLWQERNLRTFLKKCLYLENQLVPDFLQYMQSCKACIDDDFSYYMWELGSTYLYQTDRPDLMAVDVKVNEVWVGSQKISFTRKVKSDKQRKSFIPKRLRKKEKKPGDWSEKFSDDLCSYPKEDIVIENFGNVLRKKGETILSDLHCRTQAFEQSFLDGIDFKETIRNWHEGKVYVKQFQKIDKQVGSVVMIFDEDNDDERFPYKMTWIGEHNQESDLAFYGTDYKDNIVGPGIGASQYGGFLMCYPPGRLYDVWIDPDYISIPKKSEVLLVAGIEYSLEKHIVYVAKHPPRKEIKILASRFGKHIIYIPLSSFSPHTLNKIRRFHILAGHDKRDIIKDYI